MIIGLITFLTVVYCGLFTWFIIGMFKAKKPSFDQKEWPSVSVIVPLHNEENNLGKTIDFLSKQDYKGFWEVICVNDRSTDGTLDLLKKVCVGLENFSIYSLPQDLEDVPSPKKRALDKGFALAKYDILMTMDADCIPSKTWITSMASNFQGDVAIVQGPKQIIGGNSLVHQYQKLETLGFTLIEAAGFSMKKPILASAAALAYKKDLYYKVNGFSDLMEFSSGDDDMLVHKMSKVPGVDYCYNADPDAMVYTEAANSFRELLNQHARWASNGANYSSKKYVFLLTLVFAFYCYLLVAPFLALAGVIDWELFWVPLIVKAVWDFVFLYFGGRKLGVSKLILSLPITEIIQVPLIVLSTIAGQLNLFKWK